MRRALMVITLLALAAGQATGQSQLVPGEAAPQRPDARALLHWWDFGNKDVTRLVPSTYQVGALYRLRQDVIVEFGGTDGRVTQYWVKEFHPANVAAVKEELADPQAAKVREKEAFRTAAAGLIMSEGLRDAFVNGELRRMQRRSESRTILSAGTQLRFHQIWLRHTFEMGDMLRAYALVLDGPLSER